MSVKESRIKARRMKELLNRGMYLQEAQRIVDTESRQREGLRHRLKDRPRIEHPDVYFCEYLEE